MDLGNATWRKARRSAEHGVDCMEIAPVVGAVAVRDSMDPDGSKIMVNQNDFKRFAKAIKDL